MTVQLPPWLEGKKNRRSIMNEMAAGIGTAALPYISIKGGSFTLFDSNGESRPVETRWLDCVLFDVNRNVAAQRVFWGLDDHGQPKEYDELGKPPQCFSDNGIGASMNAPDPQSQSCASCRMSRFDWVSKRDPSKRRTACTKIKKAAVYPVEGTIDDGNIYNAQSTFWPETVKPFPFLLRIPVKSHENLRAYVEKFRGQNFDLSEVVTRISFVRGEVGQLDFEVAGFLDQRTEETIEGFLATNVTDNLLGRNDKPWTGTVSALPQGNLSPSPAPVQESLPLPPPPAAAPSPFVAAEPAKRKGRPPALKMAEDKPAENPAPGLPPFLQRNQPTANGPTAAIQPAPAPSPAMQASLKSIFGLKT